MSSLRETGMFVPVSFLLRTIFQCIEQTGTPAIEHGSFKTTMSGIKVSLTPQYCQQFVLLKQVFKKNTKHH